MGEPIFVFGTLLDPDIRAGAMGPHWRRNGARAALFGFARRRVLGQDYPALARLNGAAVHGMLLPAPDRNTLARLDRHEGAEYCRHRVWVRTQTRLVLAQCYLTAPSTRLARSGWRLDARWRRRRETYRRRQFSPASSRITA